jgi:hypothetical protein
LPVVVMPALGGRHPPWRARNFVDNLDDQLLSCLVEDDFGVVSHQPVTRFNLTTNQAACTTTSIDWGRAKSSVVVGVIEMTGTGTGAAKITLLFWSSSATAATMRHRGG